MSLKQIGEHLIVHVPLSNDIHILDTNLRSVKLIKGIESESFECEAIRKSRFFNEGDNFIWFRGGGVISLIDLGETAENI